MMDNRKDIDSGSSCPPVLLLAFNRPDTTAKVIESLRRVRPHQVFLAVDGPRAERPSDYQRVLEVQQLAGKIDWPCTVQTLFRDSNLGCKRAVSEGITWFFDQVEDGIILEDDCVADASFFRFAAELLERYRNERRVMMISGNNFQFGRAVGDASYYFSRHTHIWGWATWRRAWNLFDYRMTRWSDLRANGWLEEMLGNPNYVRYWRDIFDTTHDDRNRSWAYRWTYSVWANGGMAALPNRNLVSNIGFGSDATHTWRRNHALAAMPVDEMRFPLVHPTVIQRDREADDFTERTVFRSGSFLRHIARLAFRHIRGLA